MTLRLLRNTACLAALCTAAASIGFAQQPIAYVPTQGVTVSGSLQVANGRAVIGNNGTIAASGQTARVTLARGGQLDVCESTKVHLSADSSLDPASHPGDNAIMISLDRGAFEAHYKPGEYSDVVMTPDLRTLISGPGTADLSLRVGQDGDTCIDNHGANAPYVTVTNLFSGGIYRVQPNQRVLLEHASVDQVVDNEPESCGCPTAPPLSIAGSSAQPVHAGGPSSTPEDTEFPLAESEGLQSPPPPPSTPVVPIGTPHAEVAVPLTYSSSVADTPTSITPDVSVAAQPPAPPKKPHHGLFGSIGHFFSHAFRG